MKQFIIGLIITTVFLACSERNDAQTVKRTLAETSWYGEKQAKEKDEDGNTLLYSAHILFEDDTVCTVSEIVYLIEQDMASSYPRFQGTYKIEGPFIYITNPSGHQGQGQETYTLKFDGDKIAYTGIYADYTLEKQAERENNE